MADPFAELLDYLVRHYVITDAQKDVDLNATAEQTADTIETEKERAVSVASEQARRLYPAFRSGLLLAFEAQGVGRPEIRLDDRDPEQNAIADALITYLVGFGLAESRSVETEPGHYEYFIAVNWDRLYEAAMDASVDLPAVLARSATIPEG